MINFAIFDFVTDIRGSERANPNLFQKLAMLSSKLLNQCEYMFNDHFCNF